MKSKAFLILYLLLHCLTSYAQHSVESSQKKASVSQRLQSYWASHQLHPLEVLKNDSLDHYLSDVRIGGHHLLWNYNENNGETKIQIDDDFFSLEDKVTINEPSESVKDSVNFSNNWDEIHYYKIDGRELIALRMSYYYCVGSGCSVYFYLVYDVKTKTKNFFGTFKTDNDLALYSFARSGKIEFVAKSYVDPDAGQKRLVSHRYELYALEEDGTFRIEKNKNGQPYYIQRYFHFIKESEIQKKWQQHWVEKIH